MASNQPGYPPQGYQDQAQYGQEVAQDYSGTPQPGFEQPAAPLPAGGKKKRAYAGQAFEFGAGPNAGAQPPAAAAAAFPGAGPATGYGYPAQQPQQMGYQQPAYGDAAAQQPQAAYGQPAYAAPAAYQAPDASYVAPGAAPMMQGGVAGVTQQFSQMGMGQSAQPAPAQQPAQPMQRLNPLVPVDLSVQGQPFQVADLDVPPPPIILPPNVSQFNEPLSLSAIQLTRNLVERDSISKRQLPAQVYSFHPERYSLDQLPAQEIQAPVRSGDPALCHPSRC